MITAKPGVLAGTDYEGLSPEELTRVFKMLWIPDPAVIVKLEQGPGSKVQVWWELPSDESVKGEVWSAEDINRADFGVSADAPVIVER